MILDTLIALQQQQQRAALLRRRRRYGRGLRVPSTWLPPQNGAKRSGPAHPTRAEAENTAAAAAPSLAVVLSPLLGAFAGRSDTGQLPPRSGALPRARALPLGRTGENWTLAETDGPCP